MWGGGSVAAARRAGRYGMGLLAQANVPGMQEEYERSCHQYGHEPGVTLLPPRDTHTVCFVADDVERAWQQLGPYLLHDTRSYAEWNPDNTTSAGITSADTVDQLRETSRSHRIFTVPEAAALVASGEMLNLSPLCGDFLRTKRGPTSNALPNRSSQWRPLPLQRCKGRAWPAPCRA